MILGLALASADRFASPMSSNDLVALVHLAGFATGVALYGMLLAMSFRASVGAPGDDVARGPDRMPLSVAALGLVWNGIALVSYAVSDFGLSRPSPWLLALGFTALGFLPAVVVHSAMRPRATSATGRSLVLSAYALSAVAGALHFVSAASGEAPSRTGLLALTVGYALILVALTAMGAHDRSGWRRSLFIVALAAFAVSALHLSRHSEGSDPWLVELVGHHASLPLVLVILYQDYRFAFADLFLRRALSLLALVALAVTLHVLLAAPLIPQLGGTGREALMANVTHIALWVVTALAYPWIRRGVWRFVDRVVLGRVDYRELRAGIAAGIGEATGPEDALDRACQSLATTLGAGRVAWRVDETAPPAPHPVVVVGRDTPGGARVRVPTTDAPGYDIEIGDLAAGRRLLSDDFALLEWTASLVARRIDHARVERERYDRDLREREILGLATEAELRALRAQLNPHFLFNALTTIGYLLQTAPDRALATLYRLTSLLRAVLRRSSGELVTLGDELDLVDAYLAIERARFEERLTVTTDVDDALRDVRVPPLVLQPLVENAVKHGISLLARGGRVMLAARVEQGRGPHPMLCLSVADTGAGFDGAAVDWRRSGGVGLVNLEQRLARHYGGNASLSVEGVLGRGTRAEVRIPYDARGTDAHARDPAGDRAGDAPTLAASATTDLSSKVIG